MAKCGFAPAYDLESRRDNEDMGHARVRFAKLTSDLPESKEIIPAKHSENHTCGHYSKWQILLRLYPLMGSRGSGIVQQDFKRKLGDGEHKTKRVFLSADGKRAITTGSDKTARIWNVETEVMLASLPRDGDVGRRRL